MYDRSIHGRSLSSAGPLFQLSGVYLGVPPLPQPIFKRLVGWVLYMSR